MGKKRQDWYKIFSATYTMKASAGRSAAEPSTATGSDSQDLAPRIGGITTFGTFLNKFWKKKKVITGFPLKYFSHFMLVDNTNSFHFTLNNGIQRSSQSKMKHIWGRLLWGWNMKRFLKLLKWKMEKKKAVQIKMHFMFKISQRNRLPETTFHKLVFSFNWPV